MDPFEKRLAWMTAQAGAIWWMTDGMIRDLGPQNAVGYFVINVIIVAFMTALITNVWDWLGRMIRRLAYGAGFGLAWFVSRLRGS